VAVKTLPFYKNYFNIAYPLPKMDLIAIADFAAGNALIVDLNDSFVFFLNFEFRYSLCKTACSAVTDIIGDVSLTTGKSVTL